MIKLTFLVVLVSLFTVKLCYGQINIDSIGHVDYQLLHDANLNDVWAYVDETGREYAIVGTTKGTSVVDVTNPMNPTEVFWIPGTESIWRDPCVYGDVAIVTTEAQDGLLLIDLSPLPQSNNLPTTVYTGPISNPWQSAHTCFADSSGYAYIFGANRGNRGVIILDIHSAPMQPIEVGTFDEWYVHDGYVRNDTMFLAHIADGFFSLVDISDRTQPQLIATQITPDNFTHNIWPDKSGRYVFTTDEISGAYIVAYDIRLPDQIREVDRIQNSSGSGVLPHNTHVLQDYLITSYYSDGITIHDITDPENMILVGEFDTYPGQTMSYDGCWGVYPFLPSGLILASDITEGLFLLQPSYTKGAYLKGFVYNSQTNAPVEDVSITLLNQQTQDYSFIDGHYKTGCRLPGQYTARYEKVGYYPKDVSVNLLTGLYSVQDVFLDPIPPFNVLIKVVDAVSGSEIMDAQVKLEHPLIIHEGTTNGLGERAFQLYYRENYLLSVGKWGMVTICLDTVLNDVTSQVVVALQRGFYDDFTFDFGWTAYGTAQTGFWERGKPYGVEYDSAPKVDVGIDCSNQAFVTGNMQTNIDFLDDVSGGFTELASPFLDLTLYNDPYLNVATWMYSFHANPSDDTLKIYFSDGFTNILLYEEGGDGSTTNQWKFQSVRLLDFIPILSSGQFKFYVSDEDTNINITEAGVDMFSISEGSALGMANNELEKLPPYPNPFDKEIHLPEEFSDMAFTMIDITGKLVMKGFVNKESRVLEIDSLDVGVYFLQIGQKKFRLTKG